MNPLADNPAPGANNQPLGSSGLEIPKIELPGNITDGISNTANSITDVTSDLADKTTSAIDDATEKFSKPIEDITSTSKSFLESNSLITKFVFVIGILLIFIFILRVLIELVGYVMSPKGEVYLISGTAPTTTPQKISVNPNDASSKPILRSKNRKHGIEFTYSIWLYVDSLKSKETNDNNKYNIVFNKGNKDTEEEVGNKVYTYGGSTNLPMIAAPGLFFNAYENKLLVRMNYISRDLADSPENGVDIDNTGENIEIDELPIKKWFNVMIKCKGNILDVLINGTLTKRSILNGIPKQNYYDVHVNPVSPFTGYISNLKYYNRYLGTNETNMLINKGPNLKNYKQSMDSIKQTDSKYISLGWFFN